ASLDSFSEQLPILCAREHGSRLSVLHFALCVFRVITRPVDVFRAGFTKKELPDPVLRFAILDADGVMMNCCRRSPGNDSGRTSLCFPALAHGDFRDIDGANIRPFWQV